jgi:hypothetical protein
VESALTVQIITTRSGRPSGLRARSIPETATAIGTVLTKQPTDSRLLFGGYGTPALAAPREADLLAFDSAVVVDEAHLAGQLLVTARQVARLATAAQKPVTGVPALQVVEVTATPAPGAAGVSVTVDHDDLAEQPLADRLTRSKPVSLIPVPSGPRAPARGRRAPRSARRPGHGGRRRMTRTGRAAKRWVAPAAG